MKNLTLSEFKTKVLESDKPVLIDFYADWCGPCRALTPILNQLETECTDAVIYKVNIDNEEQLASNHSVSHIPSLVFYNQGKEVRRIVGGGKLPQLREQLNSMIEHKSN